VSATQLPVLVVIAPLLAAPVALLLRRYAAAGAVVTAACVLSFAAALALAARVATGGAVSYALGSWPPPWGIEYRVDALGAFVLVLVSGVAALVSVYALAAVAVEVRREQGYLYHTMYALCVAGMLGMAATGDAFNLFVFMEIASLASYVLIALGRDRRALLASYQYLILGTIGATFYVIGVALLYLMTGTLNLADMAGRLEELRATRPVRAALAFITVGLSLKFALFPLHLWLPNAYAHGPSAATALLAATATKVQLYVLVRFYFSVFGAPLVVEALPLGGILIGLSVLAIVSGSLAALWQADLRRLFAYSSVAQVGYVTLGVGLMSVEGLTAAVVHLFNHGVTKAAIFLLLGAAGLGAHRLSLERVRGLGQRMPWTALGLTVAGLSLVGVPGTAGFVTKWYLVLGAIAEGRWWLAAVVVATSLLALAYVWRFVEAAYLAEPPARAAEAREAPLVLLVPGWLMVAACVYFGLDTSFTVGSSRAAAEALVGGAR